MLLIDEICPHYYLLFVVFFEVVDENETGFSERVKALHACLRLRGTQSGMYGTHATTTNLIPR